MRLSEKIGKKIEDFVMGKGGKAKIEVIQREGKENGEREKKKRKRRVKVREEMERKKEEKMKKMERREAELGITKAC